MKRPLTAQPGKSYLFVGCRCRAGAFVDAIDEDLRTQPLPLRHDLNITTPAGFSWGFEGAAPNNLSISLLAFLYGPETALDLFLRLTRHLVCTFPYDEWELPSSEIRQFVESFRGCGK